MKLNLNKNFIGTKIKIKGYRQLYTIVDVDNKDVPAYLERLLKITKENLVVHKFRYSNKLKYGWSNIKDIEYTNNPTLNLLYFNNEHLF